MMNIFDEIEADAKLAERRRIEAQLGKSTAAPSGSECKEVDLDDLLDF